tara:strand:- start:395 stop:757 length:363 start_codon:yes stop_codon:yes gene_type:complete
MSKTQLPANFFESLTGSWETQVTLHSQTKHPWSLEATAKIDTGAFRSSIDSRLAKALRLHTIGETNVRNAMGKEKRKTALLTIDAFGNRSIIEVTVANRRKMTTPFIIGLDLLREDADDE